MSFSMLSSHLHHLALPPPHKDTLTDLLTLLSSQPTPPHTDKPSLIKAQTLQIHALTSLKLNPLKLYLNDESEIAKLARYVLECTREKEGEKRKSLMSVSEVAELQRGIHEVRKEIGRGTEEAAEMWEKWGNEEKMRPARAQALARNLDMTAIGNSITTAVADLKIQIQQTNESTTSLDGDLTTLKAKIEKRRIELQRAQKRLKGLAGVRPAWMDEFESLEKDLIKVYDRYVSKFRNLAYYESLVEEIIKVEQNAMMEQAQKLRSIQKRVQEEEMAFLKGGASTDILDSGELLRNDSFEISDDDDSPPAIQSAFSNSAETRHARFDASASSSPSERSERISSSRQPRGDRIHTPATTLGGTFDDEDEFGDEQEEGGEFEMDEDDANPNEAEEEQSADDDF